MKIGIVGNSHLAALKFGFDEMDHKTKHDLTFWGAPGSAFKSDIKITPDTLSMQGRQGNSDIKQKTGMSSVFNATDYDAVVFYAQSLRVETIARNLHAIRRGSFSSNLTHLASQDIIEQRFSMKFAHAVDTQKVKLLLYASPLPTHEANGPDVDISDATSAMSEAAKLAGALFAHQPDDTRNSRSFTKSKFVVGNYHQDGKIRKNDYRHMNAEFGTVVLKHMLEILE